MPHIAIVVGGLAGTLLAWRLRPRARVSLFSGAPGPDATSVSGGLTRGFEPDPATAALAAESLAELYADDELRADAGYRETGSLYVLPPGADVSAAVKVVEEWLPGSAEVLDDASLHRLGLRGLPAGAVAVRERRAGHLDPARLRDTVRSRLDVRPAPVAAVSDLAGGHDAVVVAAGAWTPQLLPAAGLRTRRIQYTLFRGGSPGWGSFVDETSGLYGRSLSPDTMLLGLPTTSWDVDPAQVRADPSEVAAVAATAAHRFGRPARTLSPIRTVAAADCYTDPPGLLLRRAGPLFTFTGGSGGAAKTVVAASRHAATALLTALGA